MAIRIGDVAYTAPFQASTRQRVYKPGTWLVTVEYDDGDRHITAAPADVLAAFQVGR